MVPDLKTPKIKEKFFFSNSDCEESKQTKEIDEESVDPIL